MSVIACLLLLWFASADRAADHYQRGIELKAKGDDAASLAEFTTAVRLDPNSAEARYALAGELMNRGRPAEAVPRPTRIPASIP